MNTYYGESYIFGKEIGYDGLRNISNKWNSDEWIWFAFEKEEKE
jgi:hypothetical protein